MISAASKIEPPAPAPPPFDPGDAPATEPTRRKRITTVDEINKRNKAFWDKHEPPPPPPDPLAIIRAHLMRELAREAVRANDAARRAKGTMESSKARAEKSAKRNRSIQDAHAAGMTAKQIAGDPKSRGKKKLSESQINRILKAPRP
jgi:hypothetical protein